MQQIPQTSRYNAKVLPLWLTQTLVGVLALVIGQTQGQTYLVMYLYALFCFGSLCRVLGGAIKAKGFKKPIALGGFC